MPRTTPRSFPRLDLSCGARLGALGTLLVAFLAGCGSGADPSSSTSPGGAGAGGSGGSGASGSGGSGGAAGDTPGGVTGGQSSTPVSTPKQQVLDYFAAVTAEKKTIAGQHNKYNDTPAVSSDWIEGHTGKRAGLWSADFGFGQGALDNRGKMIAEAKAQWSQGAVVQIMYHNCIPTQDELCGWDDIGGANPQHLSDSQWSELVTDGTPLNAAWKARLDGLSPYFADLKAAGVAPLFRPLHEMNQGVFWWGGRGGENGTRKLFQITHDYLTTTKGFDNIVWVWDIQDFGTLGSDVNSYDPGPAYYDIAALDVYDGGYEGWKYDAMVGVAGDKPIAIGECQKVPTSEELAAQPRWSFFMLWPDFLDDNAGALPALYGAPNVITLDQMPGWK